MEQTIIPCLRNRPSPSNNGKIKECFSSISSNESNIITTEYVEVKQEKTDEEVPDYMIDQEILDQGGYDLYSSENQKCDIDDFDPNYYVANREPFDQKAQNVIKSENYLTYEVDALDNPNVIENEERLKKTNVKIKEEEPPAIPKKKYVYPGPRKKGQFQCDYCPKRCHDEEQLERHEMKHTGYTCKICQKTFLTHGTLKKHQDIHTDKRFDCNFCGKIFVQISNLKRHEKVHSNDRPFACRFCDDTFKFKELATLHERIHTGEKPFACAMCPKRFSSSSARTVHEKIHTGVNTFSCDFCLKTFSTAYRLKRHVTNVHMKGNFCDVLIDDEEDQFDTGQNEDDFHSEDKIDQPALDSVIKKENIKSELENVAIKQEIS